MPFATFIAKIRNSFIGLLILQLLTYLIVIGLFTFFKLPSYLSYLATVAHIFIFTTIMFGKVNVSFQKIVDNINEPLSALDEVISEYKVTKTFNKRFRTDFQVEEINSIFNNMNLMSKEVSFHHSQLISNSVIESAVGNYFDQLMKMNHMHEIIPMLNETIKKLIDCDFGTLMIIEGNRFIPKFEWNKTNAGHRIGQIQQLSTVANCPAIRSGWSMSRDEVYGCDGCGHCKPIPEHRQSSFCYTFSNNGIPYLIIHLGQRTSNFFGTQHYEIIQRLENSTNLRLKQIQNNDEMKQKAENDGLTGLKNKRYITEELSQWITNRKPFGIILLDIDNFKKINDSYGHLIGDQVLKGIGSIILNPKLPNSFGGRYGGEELLVAVSGDSFNDVLSYAEEIRIAVMNHPFVTDRNAPLHVTTSIGVSFYPKDGDSYETVFKKADDALYKAKQSGKNKVMYWQIPKSE